MSQIENQTKPAEVQGEVQQPREITPAQTQALDLFSANNTTSSRDSMKAATDTQVGLGNLPGLQLTGLDTGSGTGLDSQRNIGVSGGGTDVAGDNGTGTGNGGTGDGRGNGDGKGDGTKRRNTREANAGDLSIPAGSAGNGTPEVTLASAGGVGNGRPELAVAGAGREGRTDRAERPGAGDVGQAEGAEDKPPEVDRRASQRFISEHDRVVESVRQQMPPGVRETLKDIGSTPVRSIERGAAAGVYDPNTKELLLAERRPMNAPLESVAKHEFGHAFDFNQPDGKPLSENPEFRKLVDDYVSRNPQLRMMRDGPPGRPQEGMKDQFYGEIFADMFARNLNAPRRDLSTGPIDRQMPAVQDWVRRRMN